MAGYTNVKSDLFSSSERPGDFWATDKVSEPRRLANEVGGGPIVVQE